jgi:Ca-activated chloride channel homolog
MQWSGTATTHQAVPWRLLATPADVEAFAADAAAAARPPLSYYTAIGHGIAAGIRLIEGNDYQGRERKIDISGDGRSNAGPPPGVLRQLAIRRGITINGLAILTDDADLANYYAGEVSGGPGSFTVTASSYRDFAQAFARKLYRELLPRTAGRGSGPAMAGR